MDNYICKIATKEELLKRWDYLIKIHPGNSVWEKYRDNAINNFENGNTISYLGFLDSEAICEITAYIKNEAFIGDISDSSGLLSNDMVYLAAFRTNKEFEGKGYFSKLYHFVEDNLRTKGYTALSLGVGPDSVRNIEIYFHLGFREYIKTTVEFFEDEVEYVNFYKKKI